MVDTITKGLNMTILFQELPCFGLPLILVFLTLSVQTMQKSENNFTVVQHCHF